MQIQQKENLDEQTTKFEIFINNVNRILNYFKNNHCEVSEGEDVLVSYPKYLNGEHLFSLQLKDSSFQLTILIQYWIVFSSFLRPVSVQQKKSFILNETMRDQINEILNKITSLIEKFSDYGKTILNILKNEENWETWKEKGCPSYEKLYSIDLKKELEEIKQKVSSRKNKFSKISKGHASLFKIDSFNSYDFNSAMKVNIDGMLNLKNPPQYYESLNSDNPFLGKYLERVMKDNDPEMGIEEGISKIDEVFNLIIQTFNWKFIRLVSSHEISKVNNENKVNGIVKEYADKYKLNNYEFKLKETNEIPQNINSNKINDIQGKFKLIQTIMDKNF